MYIEPEMSAKPKNCCGISIRRALLILGYLRLPYNLFLLFNDGLICLFAIDTGSWLAVIIALLFLLVKVSCLTGTLILITAGHKRSLHLLKMYYRCEIMSAIAMYIDLMVFVFLSAKTEATFARFINLTGLVYFGIQLYVILLAKNEIFRMQSKQQVTESSVDDTDIKCEE